MRKKSVKPQLLLPPGPHVPRGRLKTGAPPNTWLRLKRQVTATHALVASAVVYLVLSIAFTASFFWPKMVNFSFAKDNCFTSPTLLPDLIAKNQGQTFSAQPKPAISVAGYPLYSQTTCITPTKAPLQPLPETLAFSPLGVSFLKKSIRVSAGSPPSVNYETVLNNPIATKKPLVLPLSSADRVFGYRLIVDDQSVGCDKLNNSLVCDITKLKLGQSTGYTFSLERLFKNKLVKTLFSQEVSTVGAVRLVSSSVKNGQTVYDVPTQISLTFNKTIKTYSGIELSQVGGAILPTTASAEGKTITVKLSKPLARSANFKLRITSMLATDSGHLPVPLTLRFATSGGPKVASISIGTYKVSTSGIIALTFDSKVSTKQNLGDFIKLRIGGSTVATNLSADGKRVIINPAANLPKCTNFSVKVLDGLQNEAGISGGSAWTYNSRTLCQTIFSIGTSVKGRSITAYRFGSGKSVIVYVGGTHGNEQSSVYSLNSWVEYLERNAHSIPSRRTIVVIPNLNPDGYALSKRTNWNNVDLNRNFPANNWKRGVTMPGGSYNPNGGGKTPLSEPESKALANYVLSLNPRLVLTYHAAAGVVMPNDADDSVALAKKYDQKSNLGYEPSSQTDELFDYDTTGSFEEWLYDKHGIPALLVELWTTTSNEFYKNQPAMWYMVTLP